VAQKGQGSRAVFREVAFSHWRRNVWAKIGQSLAEQSVAQKIQRLNRKRICQSEKIFVAGTYSTVERSPLLAVLANVLPTFITAPCRRRLRENSHCPDIAAD
jgi:hypothetical protein